jgi:hypothetical protein
MKVFKLLIDLPEDEYLEIMEHLKTTVNNPSTPRGFQTVYTKMVESYIAGKH